MMMIKKFIINLILEVIALSTEQASLFHLTNVLRGSQDSSALTELSTIRISDLLHLDFDPIIAQPLCLWL